MTSALQNRQKMDRILQELKCKMVDVEMKYSLVSSEIKQLSAQELKLNKTIEQINAEIKNETDQLTAVVSDSTSCLVLFINPKTD